MQIPLLHQQILLETERLRDLHRSIMSHSSPVPAAEMENLLQEIRQLYSLVLQLNNENALQLLNEVQMAVVQQMPTKTKPFIQTSIEPPPIQTIKQKELPSMATEEKVEDVNPFFQSASDDKTFDKKHIVSDIHEMFHDAPTVANRFSDHQTIAEKIAGNDLKKRVSDNLKSSIKDIKSAIGINEKFQFINQLFNGDAKKYNAIIEEINASHTAEIAMNHIREISDSNNWESHPVSAKVFLEIIERRFSV